MTDKIKGPETKPRSDKHPEKCDYEPHDCKDSGGKYQELKGLNDSFAEIVPGDRATRLHGRDYKKGGTATDKGKSEGFLDDTHGPPYENISRPKRIL